MQKKLSKNLICKRNITYKRHIYLYSLSYFHKLYLTKLDLSNFSLLVFSSLNIVVYTFKEKQIFSDCP